jgi:hemoglobin
VLALRLTTATRPVACPAQPIDPDGTTVATTTIYEQVGGFAVIRKIVSSFYDRVLDSPLVAHHFATVDMARQIDHQTRFIAFLMDGPASYTDDHIQRVHARLGITREEFEEVVELLTETLEDFDVGHEDIGLVMERIRRREHLIVTG